MPRLAPLPRRLRSVVVDAPARTVCALTALALLARLVALGDHIAHFDEGRVAYWALRYRETGEISYRYIVHGPFVQHVDAALFGLLGPTDAVARLPVALVGGLLPLAALLFRDRLRDGEVVALAAFLSLNPVLLYYSRFLRSSLLVAGFAFVAFGFLVRAFETRAPRYLYAASVTMALAFASKENAVVYLLVWAGASALLLDHVLFMPHDVDTAPAVVRRRWRRGISHARAVGARGLARYAGHAVGVVAVFVAVAFFFFAPRDPGAGLGFRSLVAHPSAAPHVFARTVEDVAAGFDYWFGGVSDPGCHRETVVGAYGCFLGRFLETLWVAAAPLSILAVVGFLVERYAEPHPRYVVLFAAYWGFVSVVGYPLGTDVYGAWITVNALVPLAIPAAVGLAAVARTGWRAAAAVDRTVAALSGVALVLLVAQAAPAAAAAYAPSSGDDDALVQYAQPTDDFRGVVSRVGADADGGVLLYGDAIVNAEGDAQSAIPPACGDLRELLPLQWYLQREDVHARCAADRAALESALDAQPPALVVARGSDADALDARLDGYEARRVSFRTSDETTTLFVRSELAADGDRP